MNALIKHLAFGAAFLTCLTSRATYQEVEWVKASGAQVVITDFTPLSSDRIEAKFQLQDRQDTSNHTIWCCRGSGSTGTYTCFYIKDNHSIRYDYNANSRAVSANNAISVNTDYVVRMDGNAGAAYLNGETQGSTYGYANFTVASPLVLFASHTAGTGVNKNSGFANFSSARMYYCKVWDKDGNLKLDLVPARDTDKETNAIDRCGFYDKVGRTFYPNCTGSAPLSCGDDVMSEATPVLEGLALVSSAGTYAITGTLRGLAARVGYRLSAAGLEDTLVIPETETAMDAAINLAVDPQDLLPDQVYIVKCVVQYGETCDEYRVGKIITGAPEGYKTWCPPIGSDGKASTAANWVGGVVPADGDRVNFDGDFATDDCEWDLDIEIAEWRQTELFTGKVTVDTTYDGPFTTLRVTGDMIVNGGVITHRANEEAQVNRLNVSVGGNLTVGTKGLFDARELGYAGNRFPAGGALAIHGGGRGTSYKPVYGNVYAPEDLGAGGENFPGGGAIKLTVSGTATINGTVRADVRENENAWSACKAGAGGSVYLTATSVSGEGSILASAPHYSAADNSASPSGGRIAIVLTEADSLGLNIENIKAFGCLSRGKTSTGAGTILVKTRGQTYGTLYVRNVTRGEDGTWAIMPPHTYGTTLIPQGATWVFDAVCLTNAGVLSVPEGATLALPKGFASISGDSYRAGILYLGGTIDTGDENPHLLKGGKWVFAAEAPYEFQQSVRVQDEAAIGALRLYSSPSDYRTSTISVKGDLDIAEGSYIYARGSGLARSLEDPFLLTTYYAHGGMAAICGTEATRAYGSALNPVTPGTFGKNDDSASQYPGGGVLILTVSGTLTIDGQAIATGCTDKGSYNPGGAGGSLNITAAKLTGNGIISTDGHSVQQDVSAVSDFTAFAGGRKFGCGGGGRLAIRLTDKNTKFPEFTFNGQTGLRIRSMGGVYTDYASWNDKAITATNTMASAGTVYLQGGDEKEGCGTVYIHNGSRNNNYSAWTPFPAGKEGDSVESLRGISLDLSGHGRVAISQDLRIARLTMDNTARLNLCGKRLTVSAAYVNGTKLTGGKTYTAMTAPAFIEGEGSLEIVSGMTIIIR